jgi:chromosome segregation ATPase
VEQLELEVGALREDLRSTQQRAAELEALHRRVAEQLSHEKSTRKDAEQALHTCRKEKDALEAACDAAAAEITQLREEVSSVQRCLEERQANRQAEKHYVRYSFQN